MVPVFQEPQVTDAVQYIPLQHPSQAVVQRGYVFQPLRAKDHTGFCVLTVNQAHNCKGGTANSASTRKASILPFT